MAKKGYKYPLVVIEWEDAHSNSEWEVLDENSTFPPTVVMSAGFLVKQTETAIILTLGYSEDSICDRLRIPKGMIRNVIVIKKPSG